MDPIEEGRLLRYFDEVESECDDPDSLSSSSIASDPYQDDGEYNGDPTYEPGSGSPESEMDISKYLANEAPNEDDNAGFNVPSEDEWVDDIADIPDLNFDHGLSGIKLNITAESTPEDVFKMLWTDEVTNLILKYSNAYGQRLCLTNRPHEKYSRSSNFTPIDTEELDKFLGLSLLRGQINCPTLRLSFSTDPLYYQSICLATMSCRRYEQIVRSLCCSGDEKGNDKLHKISQLLNILLNNFQEACYPNESLSLDESLLLFRGQLSFRQYMKDKAAKYGIKCFELCSTDGYVFNVEIYKGHQKQLEGALKIDSLVLRLMSPYLNNGHHLIMDNYYNSVDLSDLLLRKHKTHTTGTLRANRRNNPKIVTLQKLKGGEYIWRRKGSIYVSKWKDKRDVLMITTKHHPMIIDVSNRFGQVRRKPVEISEYNNNMAGVDRTDQLTSYHSSPRKTIRWYKKIIFHLLDLTVVNSYILYKKATSRKIPMLEFRNALIRSLLKIPESVKSGNQLKIPSKLHDNRRSKNNPNLQTTAHAVQIHFPEKIPLPNENYKRKTYFMNCRECTKHKKRVQTSWRCSGCESIPALCPSGFESYHSNETLAL